ncbi:MAG: EamA family transporter [Candidatus Promineifilaceae bacterium]
MTDNPTKPVTASPAAQSQSLPDRTTLIAFGGFVLIGGGAALSVRYIYGELAPFWSGALRFGLAALIFWALMAIRRVPLPRGRALTGAILFGSLSGAAMLLIYYGLTKTQASFFQTLAAIVPLLTLLFAAAHGLETLRRRGVAGGLLAVVGIAIAVSGSLSTGVEVSLPHLLAIVAGAACFAEAGIVIKLFPPSHPYATNAVAMTINTSILAAGSLILGETWVFPSLASTWMAMAYIVVGATVVGFLLYLSILKRWTATGASYGFVLTPIVTVILASLLTDETIALVFVAGAAVVLAGVYVGALMPAKKVAEPSVPALATEPSELAVATEPYMEDIHARPGMPNCI